MAAVATDVQNTWIERVLGVRFAPGGGGGGGRDEAMALWKSRREAAIKSLRATASKIAAAKHPSSSKAIIEIQAVTMNLTAEPATMQQVKELQTYLDTDQVVIDVSELAENIRTPLLDALSKLSAELAR